MTRAYDLYQRNTRDQLNTMRQSLIDDPANANPLAKNSHWLYTPQTHRKLDDIALAVHYHLGDRRNPTDQLTLETP